MDVPRIDDVNVRDLAERDKPVLSAAFSQDGVFFNDVNGRMHLGFVYIIDGARGGLGRRVLHGLYPWAKARGCSAMRLGVVEPNFRARHLYATEGFVFETLREADPAAKRMRPSLVLRRPL